VADSYAEFGAHESGGERRVDVAVNENQIGVALLQNRLKGLHDGCRLLSMRARADFEVAIRLRHSQLLKKKRPTSPGRNADPCEQGSAPRQEML
jgi:hypothetical protein